MTDDRKPPYQTKASPVPLNRMVTDYEKRGQTTAHLSAAFAARQPSQASPRPNPEPSKAPGSGDQKK